MIKYQDQVSRSDCQNSVPRILIPKYCGDDTRHCVTIHATSTPQTDCAIAHNCPDVRAKLPELNQNMLSHTESEILRWFSDKCDEVYASWLDGDIAHRTKTGCQMLPFAWGLAEEPKKNESLSTFPIIRPRSQEQIRHSCKSLVFALTRSGKLWMVPFLEWWCHRHRHKSCRYGAIPGAS